MAVDALWRENVADHNAVQYRQMLDGLAGWRPHTLGAAGTSGTANGGVLGPTPLGTTGPLAVTERGAGVNLSVDVAVGGALVWGTAGSGAAHRGAYFAYNDATLNVVISAADATNPRIDLIGVRIRDTAYAEADNTPVITVVTGTPAGVPAAPAVPDNFLTLASVSVPALDTTISNAQITDLRRPMAALGGVIVCDSSGEYPTVGLWEGMCVYDTTLNGMKVYNGSAWQYVEGERTSYSTTLKGASGDPNIGTTGTVTAAHTKIGQLVIVWARIAWGGTGITQGTGNYYIQLPHPAHASASGSAGAGEAYDNSSADGMMFTCNYSSGNNRLDWGYRDIATGDYYAAGANTPWVWAASDSLSGFWTYMAAS